MRDMIYIDGGIKQWKGNLHMHTTRSDGKLSYAEAIGFFRSHGYDFCMVSDHDIYWDTDEFDAEDFITLSGAEYDIRQNPNNLHPIGGSGQVSIHLNIVFREKLRGKARPFEHGARIERIYDTGITSWNRAIGEMKRRGHIVILNHPRWSRLEPEMMLSIDGCFAMEVYNHCSETVETTGESEYEWDYCLRHGKRILAVATDDCHSYKPEENNCCGGYTMVSTNALTKRDITSALDAGSFYASSGPALYDMRVENGVLKLRFSPAQTVRLVAAPGYAPTIWAKPQNDTITQASWELDPGLIYVRPEIIALDGRKAWGPPVFLSDILD